MSARMTRATALAKSQKAFGKNAAIVDSKEKSSPELRAAGSARIKTLKAVEPIRSSDEYKPWSHDLSNARHASMYYRFRVGRVVMGLMFSVEGEGDTWAEAFAAYETRLAEDRARHAERAKVQA